MTEASLDVRVEEARQSGDTDRLVQALLARGNQHAIEGSLAHARQDFLAVAELEEGRGAHQAEARARQFVASLYRFEGDWDAARASIQRATDLVEPGTPLSTAVWTEAGEIESKAGHHLAAFQAFEKALAHGQEAGLRVLHQMTLYLLQADSLAHAGQLPQAIEILRAAAARAEEAGEPAAALHCRVREATAWKQSGDRTAFVRAWQAAEEAARAAQDDKALGDLALLDAGQALEDRNPTRARKASEKARQHALATRDGFLYIASSLALSQACEMDADRPGAYGALAVGWVTLKDLVGEDLARATYEPRLRDLANRWGRTAFEEAKSACESRMGR